MIFIKSMFTGPNGDISSKRIAAFVLIISGIIYAFIKSDHVMCGELIGSGLALLGIGAVTKS